LAHSNAGLVFPFKALGGQDKQIHVERRKGGMMRANTGDLYL